MDKKDLILNIAINLDRISRFIEEGNKRRAKTFIEDNNYYISQIDKKNLNKKFQKTFNLFENKMKDFKDAEDFLTWANILQHRAKLA